MYCMSKFNRRSVLRSTGLAVGLPAATGLASAAGDRSVDPDVQYESPIEVKDRVAVQTGDQKGFAAARAVNTETGEVSESVIEYDQQLTSAHTAKDGATKRIREKKSSDVTTHRGWIELITEEIPDKADDLVKKAITYGEYFDECTGVSGYGDHLMVGASIEYDESLNAIGGATLGSMLGATLGFLAGIYTGPGSVAFAALGAILGAGVGTLVGFALDALKDSNILTFTGTDWGICGFGACTPGIMLQGSGRWNDTDKDQYKLWLHQGDHLNTY